MTPSAFCTVFFVGVSLLASARANADEPGQDAMSVQVLPAQRTPVHVWPIMRGCVPDKATTTAVVTRLGSDPRLHIHRLAIPRDPKYLSCLGSGCAELLHGAGCAARSGILVGGEIDEATCDANDKSLAGCHGQLVSRLRVFRIDLDQSASARGDFRYAWCQDQRCGAEGKSVEEALAQLAEQLIGAQSLPASIPIPRSSPELPEQCMAAANAPPIITQPAAPAASITAPATVTKTAAVAYYTQFKQLNTSRAQAEAEAKTRIEHFSDGVNPPSGLTYSATIVNGKYTLFPGEELIGNQTRIATLQGFLSKPPTGQAFANFRQAPLAMRMLIIFVLDHETRALSGFVVEPNQALRPLPALPACQNGAGESADCVAAVLAAAALTPAAPVEKQAPAMAVAQPAGRSLGCIPFAERSCVAWACPVNSAPIDPMSLPVDNPHPVRWTERLLYGAMGFAVVTAAALTIADSAYSPAALMDDQGNTATITGLLRPAVWTAWGLSIALAVPTVISVVESSRAKQREALAQKIQPQLAAPRCAISEEHL